MKEGSLQRLPEPVPAEAASSGTDSSSRSRGREAEGEEGERREGEDGGEEGEGGEEEEWGEETEEEEAEAAAKSRGEGGVEAEPAAAEVEQLDICLVGRWAAKDFLWEMKGSRGVRVGGQPATCILPVPAARLPAPPRPGSHQASPCGFKAGPQPKDRLAALQDLQQRHADPVLTFCSLPHAHGLPHSQGGEHNRGPSREHHLGPSPLLGTWRGQLRSPHLPPQGGGWAALHGLVWARDALGSAQPGDQWVGHLEVT